MKLRKLAPALVGMSLIAAACGGGGGSDADVVVTMQDDGIALSIASVAAGELSFEGVNEGTLTHEFEVFRIPEGVDADDLPYDGDTARAEELLEIVDEVENIAPATSAALSLDLDPGNYAVICNLAGHYANGMHATFTVT